MMRGTWVLRNGEIVEKGGPKDIRPMVARSSLPRPMVISDGMNAVRSMADGQMYESKSEMRKGYKAKGVIELGTDAASYRAKEPERPKITKAEIHGAIQKVKQGYRPNLPAD